LAGLRAKSIGGERILTGDPAWLPLNGAGARAPGRAPYIGKPRFSEKERLPPVQEPICASWFYAQRLACGRAWPEIQSPLHCLAKVMVRERRILTPEKDLFYKIMRGFNPTRTPRVIGWAENPGNRHPGNFFVYFYWMEGREFKKAEPEEKRKMEYKIEPMKPEDWDQVRVIYEEGSPPKTPPSSPWSRSGKNLTRRTLPSLGWLSGWAAGCRMGRAEPGFRPKVYAESPN